MITFTKRKFLSFPTEQQHRKCLALLRRVYDDALRGQESDLAHYNEIQAWMAFQPLAQNDPKTLSDRYHWHLSHVAQKLQEPNFLPSVQQTDRQKALPLWSIAVYLDNIRSAHNVGSILRTVEALSLGTVYFSEATPYADHQQVVKTAMGATQWAKCPRNVPLSELPCPVIALETSCEAVSLHEFIFPEMFTLVLGNEEYGCSDESLKRADALVSIPMRGHKNSLNVANAFAMAAAEIARQRTYNDET